MRQFYFFFFILLFTPGCNFNKETTDNQTNSQSKSLNQIISLADIYVERYLYQFPEQATLASLKGIDQANLTDNSLENYGKWTLFIDSVYQELLKLDKNYKVNSNEWHLFGIFKEILEENIELRICKPELTAINPVTGWHITLGLIANFQEIGTPQARNNAITRWKKVKKYVENEIINLRKGIEEGYTVPQITVSFVIEQIEQILDKPAIQSEYFDVARRDNDEIFKKEWEQLINNEIYESLRKYSDFLINEYYPKARESISISSLPGGNKCYEAYYRAYTSVKRSTNQILEICDYNVKVNRSKLKMLGKKLYVSDSIPFIIRKLLSDTTHYFKTEDEMISFAYETVKKSKEKCSEYFNQLPTSTLEIRPIQSNLSKIQGSHYLPSIGDSQRPSIYYVNTSYPEKRLKEHFETEIFHETFPGHHLQIALSNEKRYSHPITKLFGVDGFMEGWASYAQIIADELNLYSSDYSKLIVLGKTSRMMYLDAQIHTKSYTKEKAITFIMNNSGTSYKAAESIVDRIVAWPGQFSSYDTGLIEILELREQAKLTLGNKFDIKEFHNLILEDGAIPLEMLRKKVNWWLGKKTANEI